MRKIKTSLTVAAVVAAAGGAILAGAGAASATGTPTPWAGQDSNAVGGLAFFDASGNQITSGSTTTAPFAKYTAGLVAPRAGDTKATLFFYSPETGNTPDNWSHDEALGLSTPYPVAGAPSPIGGTPLPVNTGNTTDTSLDTAVSDLPNNSSTTGYQNVYEIRLYTSKPNAGTSVKYDYADLLINSTTHTWTLQYTPDAPAGTATTSTLGSSSTSVNQGDTVTLTDTISPSAAPGTVQFKDGGTNIGSPVPVSGGKATTTALLSNSGTHPITAVYTPQALAGYSGSTSNTVTVTAAHVVSNTSVALAVNPSSGPAFSAVTLTATVNPAIPGKVKFFDAGSQFGTADVSGGTASTTYSGFAQGDHNNITASFTPTNATDYNPSTSEPADFNATAPTGATPAPAPIDADVAPGSLAITTPYTASNPLHVGTLTLNANGTQLTGSAQFGDGTTADGSIKIVDTRAGNPGWTASAASSDLLNGTNSINQQNVGLTGLHGIYLTGNALQAGSVTFTANPAASPALAPGAPGNAGLGGGAHAFAKAAAGAGDGTVGIYGTLTVNAPTSTAAGHYTGTVTFTVV